jgi:hypothetical protein
MTRPAATRLCGLLPVTTLILLAACASSPPKPTVDYKPDYNFSEVHKLAFYHKSGDSSGDNPIPLSDMVRDRIDLALQTALTKKGYVVVEDASMADLLISWHVVTRDKTDVRTYQTPAMGGMGYARYGGYNRYSMYNCWGCMSQTEVSVQNYTEGTFIVDLIDPKLKQSVWRGLIQDRLKGEMGRDQEKYNAAADNILASFPPP